MLLDDFKKTIEDKGWHWAEGTYDNKSGYFVKAENRQIMTVKGMQPACIFISLKGIEELKEIEPVDRALPDLSYITRIVGYYSNVHNWHPSKQEELIQRRIGDYKL